MVQTRSGRVATPTPATAGARVVSNGGNTPSRLADNVPQIDAEEANILSEDTPVSHTKVGTGAVSHTKVDTTPASRNKADMGQSASSLFRFVLKDMEARPLDTGIAVDMAGLVRVSDRGSPICLLSQRQVGRCLVETRLNKLNKCVS